jgi:peptidoglycan/LPS O-acetylase OafA/YrhL
LSAEAGLYLLFGIGAIIVALLPHRRPPVIAVAFFVIWIALLWLAWVYRPDLKPQGWSDGDWYLWLYGFSPWGVAVQFGIGVLAWRASRNISDGLARTAAAVGALGLLAIYAMCATAYVTSHVEQSLIAAISTACLMAGARSDGRVIRWLSARGIVYVGTVSYSLYLFHFAVPNLGIGGDVFQKLTLVALLYWLVTFATGVAFAIMLATGVYQLVEVPGRRLIRRGADRLLGISARSSVFPGPGTGTPLEAESARR